MSIEARSLRDRYDFIVCGAGPAGCVAAARLASRSDVRVLLIEAGPLVRDAATDIARLWPTNVGSEHDWSFHSEPEPGLAGRVIDYSMGRLVGGGSSINASVWARGHKEDWDRVAAAAGDPAWGYDAVLSIYRRVEDYAGDHDARYHGRDGPIGVRPSLPAAGLDPAGLCASFMAASAGAGIPPFPGQNGALQEAAAGASITDLCVQGSRRSSVIDAYLMPALAKGALDLAVDTLVTRIVVRDGRAVGIEMLRNGRTSFVEAGCEVIVAAGAIQTPKLLLHSGIGDRAQLRDAGIDCVANLPGVGRNLQDHPLVSLVWKTSACAPVSASAQAVAFLDGAGRGAAPDAYLLATEIPSPTGDPRDGLFWAIGAAALQPASRGRVGIVDGNPHRAPRIEGKYLADDGDLDVLERALAIAGEIGASDSMKAVASVRVSAPAPGSARDFIRSNLRSGWHLSGTCRIGGDDLSVVDGQLRVHGIAGLRLCDTSVLPSVTRGNTMAPAIVIGERMAEILTTAYGH